VATTGYTKNFVVKNGITTGPITLDASSGNIAGSNVSITANLSVTGVSTLGAPGNVKITGGTNGYVLSTDGSANLSWIAQSGGGGGSSISNGNSNVNIATANGNITFSAVGNANVMTVTGTGANIAGTANITGNIALSGANVSLGAVGNVKITGGSNGYVLQTDGTGNLSWAAQTSSNIVLNTFTGNGVQTVFTLTNSPTSEDYTIINIDGVSQLHSAYTVANANVTLSSAPVSGAAIEVMTFNLGGSAGGNASSGYTYVEATGNTNAAANTKYIVNTNSANITITLPITPSFGDEVGIIDGTGNASVHAITVSRNGSNIQGAASSMTVTTNRSAFTLVYYNASQGWVLTNV
jgi:hypothetical protein